MSLRPRPAAGVPLRPREPRRGDAAARPGRHPRPHRALVPRLGGRRRVQRRARPAPLLRAAHGARQRLRRQPGRAAARGPDPAGRRRPEPRALGRGRRRRPQRPQRPQLHRARLRRARGRRLLGPRPQRRLADEAGRRRLGRALRQAGRALVPHRRHLRGALGDDAARGARGDAGREEARHARLLRPQLPSVALEVDRRQAARAGGEPRARRATST